MKLGKLMGLRKTATMDSIAHDLLADESSLRKTQEMPSFDLAWLSFQSSGVGDGDETSR